MTKDRQRAMDALAKDIRRQMATAENSRLLRRIPLFKVDYSTPTYMKDLLGQLERQDDAGRSGTKQ